MKIKKEQGVTGIDISLGIMIFVISSAIIINLYYQIYIITIQSRIEEVAIGCITEVFEKVDLINYEDVTETRIEELIDESHMNEYFNRQKNNSYVEYSLINYQNESGVEEDLIKKIKITVVYKVGQKEMTFPISKIKIKE